MSTELDERERPPPASDERPANRILAALPRDEYERIAPDLRQVTLPAGEIVYLPEQKIEYAYFINHGMISLLATTEGGETVEAGLIGPEGLAGVSVVLGAMSTPNEILAQSEVDTVRMPAWQLVEAFRRDGRLRDLILSFVHLLFIEIAQTAACNRLHTLDQRLARWLLTAADRLKQDKFPLTQEFISRMLGVRRAGVSVAANGLREAGLIDYRRGEIVILNREGLERATCECYQIVRQEYDSILKPD